MPKTTLLAAGARVRAVLVVCAGALCALVGCGDLDVDARVGGDGGAPVADAAFDGAADTGASGDGGAPSSDAGVAPGDAALAADMLWRDASPYPVKVSPCTVASCYTKLPTFECGASKHDEDFSSGNFNMHRYTVRLSATGSATLKLRRTAGTLQPALITVARTGGLTLSDGAAGRNDAKYDVTVSADGKSGARAEVTVRNLTGKAVDVRVFVTGWRVINTAGASKLPTSAKYRLEVANTCPK